jgi:hypothetical protein
MEDKIIDLINTRGSRVHVKESQKEELLKQGWKYAPNDGANYYPNMDSENPDWKEENVVVKPTDFLEVIRL